VHCKRRRTNVGGKVDDWRVLPKACLRTASGRFVQTSRDGRDRQIVGQRRVFGAAGGGRKCACLNTILCLSLYRDGDWFHRKDGGDAAAVFNQQMW
jgi:hypothetical protein